ncbi:MAG: RagB/SusD family nutrient uptake outer membrane protein [Bacteroidaceae bacterium]|nr:RagB/SusD family nutrient uptake outer membrane protein [Bacteroidaceae bacterium]
MKSKSIIGAVLAAIFTIGFTTSCEDMFNIESSRVIYEHNHDLGSTADSAYTTNGILQCVREIADRYVILGEVRGDLVEINNLTKTSLRNIAEFNFDEANEYLNIRDYYAVINNCNYALAKMDTTLAHNNERVMVDEYAAILGIRAWTYMQMAINYGEVPYFTEPITTVAASEKEYPSLDIKEMAAELIPQLIPYVDYELPTFTGNPQVFPPLQLVLADLYLWNGDYANAWATYWDYLTTNKNFNLSYGEVNRQEVFKGYMGINAAAIQAVQVLGKSTPQITPTWDSYFSRVITATTGFENLAYITMERSNALGKVSELASLFVSDDNTHQLNASTYLKEICSSQTYIRANKTLEGDVKDYSINVMAGGDQRRKYHSVSSIAEGESFEYYDKLVSADITTGQIEYVTPQINIYRRSIVYLRAAEALNALAKEQGSDSLAVMSFNLLKDAYQVFFPKGHVLKTELQQAFIGVHARGCGDVYLDTAVYVLKPNAIAQRLYNDPEQVVTFNDTINYIDELIIDELAMEAAIEGNRFGDLVRFAERRNEPEFLAKRVASRKGQNQMDDELYNKLLDKANWYLPVK